MMVYISLLALPVLVLAKPVAGSSKMLRAEGKPRTPMNKPTGGYCAGGPPNNISPTELASAVAGCSAIQPNGTDYTRNDIVDRVCKPITLIFARGTTEDPNLGNVVGPPFLFALKEVFGHENVASQGVNDYAAIPEEYCEGGSLTASENLAELITETRKTCPKTKLCVSGYSQGAQVVHNAFELLKSDKAATDFVNSVVLWGDPDRKLPVGNVPENKVSVQCHQGDDICENGSDVLYPHLTYCHDVQREAEFVKARAAASD